MGDLKPMHGTTMTIAGELLVVATEVAEDVGIVIEKMMVLRRTTGVILVDGMILTSTATHHLHPGRANQLHEDDQITVVEVEEVIDEVDEAIPMGGEAEVIEAVEVIEAIDNSTTEDPGKGLVAMILEIKGRNGQSI